MSRVSEATAKVAQGDFLGKDELLALLDTPLEELCEAANEVRELHCGNAFELCSIMNVKSGRCSEDCTFCAQSRRWDTTSPAHPFLDVDEIVEQAKADARAGSQRFSLVASGCRVSADDLRTAMAAARRIRTESAISPCVSFGLLAREDFERLAEAGVARVHNNLETSRAFFPNVCSTHGYDDKVRALRSARAAGLEVCSGGIVGLGESWEDRVDLALELRALDVSSVPLNVLNPIAGTPLEGRRPLSVDEVRRTFALFRLALPTATLRLAGGRALLPDAGRLCLSAGANAAITGNMLTTAGFDIPSDVRLLEEQGFRLERIPERENDERKEQGR